jgi:hypothetical protein
LRTGAETISSVSIGKREGEGTYMTWWPEGGLWRWLAQNKEGKLPLIVSAA